MLIEPLIEKRATTIGKYLLDRLQAYGVNHIFGIPGDYVLQFDKMIENHEIRFINTTRENIAGLMADAYARTKGIGAACITYGVGINIVSAVSQSFVESSSLVIISGAASTKEFMNSHKLHHLFNQEDGEPRDQTQLEIFRKITVAQTVLDNPSTAASEIDRVLELCLEEKKPVYIELPRDQVHSEIALDETPAKIPKVPKSNPAALNEAISEIISILKNCKRPLIWAGHEIQRFSLSSPLLEFAEKHRIPVATTLLGKSAIGEHHPLFIGIYQGHLSQHQVIDYAESADCLLLLGVVLSDVDTGMFTVNLRQGQTILALREAVSINHHHYSQVHFADLITALGELNLNFRFKGEYPAILDRAMPPFKAQKKKITSARLFECLQSNLTSQNIIVSDFGDCLFGSCDLMVDQNAFFSNAYFASLGFGVPGAIAAQIANPEKRVICVVGDGAFQMTGMELSTALRYRQDPIVVLLNNHGYATERPLLEGEFNNIAEWSYAKLPELLQGGNGVLVETEEEFENALKTAIANRGEFTLIEVELAKTDASPGLIRFSELVGQKKKLV